MNEWRAFRRIEPSFYNLAPPKSVPRKNKCHGTTQHPRLSRGKLPAQRLSRTKLALCSPFMYRIVPSNPKPFPETMMNPRVVQTMVLAAFRFASASAVQNHICRGISRSTNSHNASIRSDRMCCLLTASILVVFRLTLLITGSQWVDVGHEMMQERGVSSIPRLLKGKVAIESVSLSACL